MDNEAKNNINTSRNRIDDKFKFVEYSSERAERVAMPGYSYWRSTFRVFMSNKSSRFLLYFLMVIITFIIIQPYLPYQIAPLDISKDATGSVLSNTSPDGVHWFGTNSIGQDLWALVWSGTRTSLFISVTAVVICAIIGITAGAIWGYSRRLDSVFTEIYNVLNNVPAVVLQMLISYMLRPGVGTMIFVMSITGWLPMAKWIRNLIMIIRDREYNLASRCLGTPSSKIIVKNLLPQLVSVVMLDSAMTIPTFIGSEVFLTYIGLGLPATIPSLGNLINDGRKVMMVPDQRYQIIFPAIVVAVITIAFYAIGNLFSDAADPRNHKL